MQLLQLLVLAGVLHCAFATGRARATAASARKRTNRHMAGGGGPAVAMCTALLLALRGSRVHYSDALRISARRGLCLQQRAPQRNTSRCKSRPNVHVKPAVRTAAKRVYGLLDHLLQMIQRS